ncbi:MAG: F0F1 ATP synthase subunit epsilon [Tissierellaceae bacterium]|nr:F0F1 ATP synthase subunit epsilon [Tissierellaceae bacterium]
MSKFHLEIVTPDRLFFEGQVDMVIVRGLEGDLAILKDHSPITTPLKIGMVKIQIDGKERIAAVVQGYITVLDNKVTIVTEAAEWPDEIDIKRAEEAKRRAELLLQQQSNDINYPRAHIALLRAINRIKVSNLNKNH